MGDEVTGAGLSAPCVFISTPDAEPVKDRVPLPETSYLQVKLAELPPSSTVPAAEAGAAARVAPALPVAVIVGAARASSRTSAPPVLRMTRVKDTGFCPADALAGETGAETERAPGACTVTGWLTAVTAAIATPAFASVPEAEQEKASVPLPDTFHTQVKFLVAPLARRSPAGEGGEEDSVAAAGPPEVQVGAGSASSRTAAPPAFCRVRTNETCCSPADTCLGDAVAVAASVPGACTSTTGAAAAGGLTAVPLLPSVPLAVAAKASVPLPETSYCQENVCDAPPGSTVPPVDGAALPGAGPRRGGWNGRGEAGVSAGGGEAPRRGGGRQNVGPRRAPRRDRHGRRQIRKHDVCAAGIRSRERERGTLQPRRDPGRAGDRGDHEPARKLGLHRGAGDRSGRGRHRRVVPIDTLRTRDERHLARRCRRSGPDERDALAAVQHGEAAGRDRRDGIDGRRRSPGGRRRGGGDVWRLCFAPGLPPERGVEGLPRAH